MSGPTNVLRTQLPLPRGRDARGAYDYTAVLGRLAEARMGLAYLEDLANANRDRLLVSLREEDLDELAEYLERCAGVTPAFAFGGTVNTDSAPHLAEFARRLARYVDARNVLHAQLEFVLASLTEDEAEALGAHIAKTRGTPAWLTDLRSRREATRGAP